MRLVSAESEEETSQIAAKVLRLVLEVPSVKVKNEMCVFAELSKVVNILENETLVEPVYKLIKVEFNHVSCNVLSL